MIVKIIKYKKKNIAKTVFWLSNSFIQESFGAPRGITKRRHRKWIQKNKNKVFLYAISFEDNHIGDILLTKKAENKIIYFQVYIGEENYRSKGFGKIAINMGLNLAFFEHKCEKVELHCYKENIIAFKTYLSLGFNVIEEEEKKLKSGALKKQLLMELKKADFIKGKE